MEVYLDNASTTQVSAAVREKMLPLLGEEFGNPSSLHRKGMTAEAVFRQAAANVAECLRVQEKEIYFTSGGTESNNWAILGAARARVRQGKHVITSAIEHPSVSAAFDELAREGFEVTVLPVGPTGLIDPEELRSALRPDTVLVSLMMVNNEIGTIEPIETIGQILKMFSPQTVFHVDAIQAFGKLAFSPKTWGIDLLSGSAHKIHGPKGTGFLYISDKVRILPIIYGGGQQKGLRSGTENMPGIAGLGEAAKEAQAHLGSNRAAMYGLRHQLVSGLKELEDVTVNGPEDDQFVAPHIVSATFKAVRSEVLLHALEDKGIYASAGSACSSHKREISPVLAAIGMDRARAESTLRFSLCRTNTAEEIEYTLQTLAELLPQLRRFTRR